MEGKREMKRPDALLAQLWKDYYDLNPEARRLYNLLTERGEHIVNDHIALRTFAHPTVGLERLVQCFEALGYERKQRYNFKEKKLNACHLEHEERGHPKVFISELDLLQCSQPLRETILSLVEQMPPALAAQDDFPICGRPWKLDWQTYKALRAESEYAAWVAAFGYRANHFTVSVNDLTGFTTLPAFVEWVKSQGFSLNTAGGEIKGSVEVYLEQASTMANAVAIGFGDEIHEIPACYYEFAYRYPMANGELFQGFVEQSADKIFESTTRKAA